MKKYGAEAAEKISNMNAQQAEKEGESEITKLQKEVDFHYPCRVLLSGPWLRSGACLCLAAAGGPKLPNVCVLTAIFDPSAQCLLIVAVLHWPRGCVYVCNR